MKNVSSRSSRRSRTLAKLVESRARAAINSSTRCIVESLESRTLLSAVYLDPTFGTNGFTSINFPGSTKDAGNAISVSEPDGKILIAGQEFDSNENVEVARLNPEGNLDTAFGNAGHVMLHYGTLCQANSIAVQTDGKILVGGSFFGQPGQLTDGLQTNGFVGVVRLNPDGTLDGSFGNGGLALSDRVFPLDQHVSHLVLQSDGKVVEGGELDDHSVLDFALTRFTSNGQIDQTFGNAGVCTASFGTDDRAADLTSDQSGNLIIVGSSTPASNLAERDIGLARFTRDGVPDGNFGIGGAALIQPTSPFTEVGAQSVVVDSANRIVLGGAAFSPTTGYDYALLRIAPAGSLDPTFGAAGLVTTNPTGNPGFHAVFLNALALQADGKIVAAGGTHFLALARYNTDGSLDTSFNDTGLYSENQPNYTNFANGAFGVGASAFGGVAALAVQPDGNIVATGTWNPGGLPYVYVTRLSDGPKAVDFSNGFADNGQLTLNGAASFNGPALSLSGGAASAFTTLPRDITEFNTQFTFKGGAVGDNFSFVIRADSPTALTPGPDHSLAVNFDLASDDIRTSVSANSDKDLPGHAGFGFNATDTYSATLNYVFFNGGSVFRMKLADLTTGAVSTVFDNNWGPIDIPALMGSGAAYVGFTSGGAAPDILSWSFTAPPLGAKPLAPSFVRPHVSPDQIALTWTDNSSNEDGFDVEKSEDGFNFGHVAYVPANTTTYTDTIAAADVGRNLFYRVRAFDSAGWSVGTPTAGASTIVAPPAPTNASAINVLPNAVDMVWQDNSNSISPYRIYRRVGGTGDFSLYAVVHQGINEYVDNQAPSGTLLEYRIVAFGDMNHANTEAQEAESAPAFVTVTTPPAAIDQFGPQMVTNGSAHLSGGSLVLTDNQPVAETGSAWSEDYQYTSQFTTNFSFQFANADPGGLTFEIQEPNPAVSDGHHALGDNSAFGFNGTVGAYGVLGLKFYLGPADGFGGGDGSGGGATGIAGGTFFQPDFHNVTSAGINFGSGHVFNVSLAYGRFILHETITDATTGATFTHTYWLHDLIGDDYELVGFSGSKPAGSAQAVNVLSCSYSGGNAASPTVLINPISRSSVQGMVWVDFNNDGNVDFGEQGIGGVPITLFGSNGNIVATTNTDSNGLYTFNHVPPDVYSISEGATPAGYVQGKDSLGTITDLQGNVISAGAGNASVQDLFSAVPIGADQNAINYNFGEQPAAGSAVSKGQAATMGFWQNKNGQALINKFASIGSWLADTLPNTFGSLVNATPQQVATLYQQKFVLTDKLDAQVMATALNVYATDASLGGSAAASYGFAVSTYGLGDSTWNIGSDGAAFNVANNSALTVMQILQDWDQQTSKTSKSIRQMALDVFGGINAKGGI